LRCHLVFDDWRVAGKSVYDTDLGVKLSNGDLHSGTTWTVEINLPSEIKAELREAYSEFGAGATFRLIPWPWKERP